MVELMVTVSVAGVVAGAASLFALEGRLSAARVEAEVKLTREASLVLEHVARDLRGASDATSEESGIQIEVGEGEPIRYVVGPFGLERRHGSEKRLLSRSSRSIRVDDRTKPEAGWRVGLIVSRPLAAGRTIGFERFVFVGRRR